MSYVCHVACQDGTAMASLGLVRYIIWLGFGPTSPLCMQSVFLQADVFQVWIVCPWQDIYVWYLWTVWRREL